MNKIKVFTILFLAISLVFIVPLNMGQAFGVEVDKGEVKSACNIVPPLDIKSSLILSIVFLCLPGIFEKAKEWENIKCEEVVCSYEAVTNSLDPSFCKKDAGYKTCKYIVGEVFAIPPMNILENMREFIAGILANPIPILIGAGIFALKKFVVGPCMANSAGCDSTIIGASAILVGVSDIAGAVLSIQQIIENGFSFGDDGEDSCSQMEDYVEELEKITKTLQAQS